jgi:hypothetical protein
MVPAGKTLYSGLDRYNCHQCGKNYDENAQEIPENEMKIIREENRKEIERLKQKSET